jgi:general secretion pathway protein H
MTKTLPTGKSNLNSLKGFSLTELLVVLTIVSILAASISYLTINRQETLNAVTTKIVQNIRMIQQRAIQNDQPYQIEINLGNNSLHFVDQVIELSGDVSVTVRTAENQLIDRDIAGMTFYPDASSSGGVITLETDEEIYEISVIWISGKITTRHQAKLI